MAFLDVLACRVAAIWGRKPMVKLVSMSLLLVRAITLEKVYLLIYISVTL